MGRGAFEVSGIGLGCRDSPVENRTIALYSRTVIFVLIIGKIVKRTRKKLGVTQRNLALTSGTGLRFIIELELEQGKPTCQLEKVLTVIRTLGIKLTIKGK